MNLTELLDQEFADDYKLDAVKNTNRLYDLVQRGSRHLFVTIGDSWTYGARLDEECTGPDKEQYRIENCYGHKVSEQLNSDFLNLGIPGINNLWMVSKYRDLCNLADQIDYDKITIFITLTEYGREIESDFDTDPVLNSGYRTAKCHRDLAVALNEYLSDMLLEANHPKVNLVLGINYVTNIYPEKLQSYFVPSTWLEVLVGNTITEECMVVGSWVIPKFKTMLGYNNGIDPTTALIELESMIAMAEKRLDIIYNTGYNYKQGYGHPNSTGHQLWANYIIQNASIH